MKKVLCFLFALVILLTSLTVFVGKSLFDESENVTYRLVDEWGDRQYLSGVTADFDFSYYTILNWNSEFSPTGESKSTLTFDRWNKSSEGYRYNGLSSSGFGIHDLKFMNNELNTALDELKAEAVNPGDIRTRTFMLRDYFEYYPIWFGLDLNDISIYWESGRGFDSAGKYNFSGITPSRGQAVTDTVSDYFRIPVTDDASITTTVHAGDRNSFSWRTSSKNEFDFFFYDAVFSDTVYFSFSNVLSTSDNGETELADTSLIPGGYGIYALPYSENDINYEALDTVYSVSSDSTVKALFHDEKRNELYLSLYENGRYTLHIIDRETMTDIAVFDLFECETGAYVRVAQYDDFFVFIKNETEFVIVKRENEVYSKAFSGVMPAEYVADRDYFHYNSKLAFDGERLVVLTVEGAGDEEIKIMSIQPDIMVFTEDGVQYYGKWVCSLGNPVTGVVIEDIRADAYSIRIS